MTENTNTIDIYGATDVERTVGLPSEWSVDIEYGSDRVIITHDRIGVDPEADPEPLTESEEEWAYALALSERDAMTLAHFLRHLDRKHMVTLPDDIREVVMRVYENESEKH